MRMKVDSRTAERYVKEVARRLVDPHGAECLRCYLRRMISSFGCDHTLRWVIHWQRHTPVNTRGLRPQLARRGGSCDCVVVFDIFHTDVPPSPDMLTRCDDADD